MDRADVALFDEARAAGMTGEQAGRWVAYVAMKATKGEKPITLGQAVRQVENAHRTHRQRLARIATVTVTAGDDE